MRHIIITIFLLMFSLHGFSQSEGGTLVFSVRKSRIPAPEAVADLPVTLHRTYAADEKDLTINEVINLMPGKWVADDSTLYNGSPLQVQSFRLFFAYDKYLVSLDQRGCNSEDLMIVLDRLRKGKPFYIDKIWVYNPKNNRKYRMYDVALTFVKN